MLEGGHEFVYMPSGPQLIPLSISLIVFTTTVKSTEKHQLLQKHYDISQFVAITTYRLVFWTWEKKKKSPCLKAANFQKVIKSSKVVRSTILI